MVTRKKVEQGRLVMSGRIADLMHNPHFSRFALGSLTRHLTGNWGNLMPGDKKLNDQALAAGDDRLLSSYEQAGQPKIWIITEGDRSATTILLPEEY